MTNLFFEPPFGDLGVTYALRLQLVEKRVFDFLFAIIVLFSLALTFETLLANIGRSQRFSEGMGHFERKF